MAHLVHLIHRFPPAPGGAESVALRVCKHLADRGHQIRVETTTGLDPDSFHKPGTRQLDPGISLTQGIETRRHPLFRFPLQRPILGTLQRLAPHRFRPWLNWYSPLCPGLGKLAGDPGEPPDVVVVWALPHGSVWEAGRQLARKKGVPLVSIPLLHPGNPLKPNCPIKKAFRQPWLMEILRESTRVICLTEWEREELRKEGIPESSLVVTGLGQDPEAVSGGDREAFRKKWRIDPDYKVVGHLANLSSGKGSLDLLEARSRFPEAAKILVVLAGNSTNGFLKQAKPYQDKCWLRLIGPLDERERRDFFAGCDLMCLPSVVESWSQVVLEAWSAGLGVVVYDAGGPGFLVHHGQDGWKIPPGDIPALADFLANSPTKSSTFASWGREGRRRLLEEFAWPQALAKIENALINPG